MHAEYQMQIQREANAQTMRSDTQTQPGAKRSLHQMKEFDEQAVGKIGWRHAEFLTAVRHQLDQAQAPVIVLHGSDATDPSINQLGFIYFRAVNGSARAVVSGAAVADFKRPMREHMREWNGMKRDARAPTEQALCSTVWRNAGVHVHPSIHPSTRPLHSTRRMS